VANVLNKLPPSLQGRAKPDLHAIHEAENRRAAEDAFDRFVAKHGARHDKAVACLVKDRDVLLTFYDFPAEHGKHVRTTNPLERTFATVRRRTDQTKGCLSRQTALAMITSVKVVEIRGRSAVAIGQAAWGGTSEGGLGVASPSISGGASSAIASTCM
jgi:transposase-like protein